MLELFPSSFYKTGMQWNLSIKNHLGHNVCMSSIQRLPQFRVHLIHYSTTLGLRMVSLLQRFPQFRGHLMHYSTTLGFRMVSLLQRFPQFKVTQYTKVEVSQSDLRIWGRKF